MALRRDAKILKMKAICSLRTAMATFNSYDDSGRVDSVLLHLQHATEMLLKAVLRQAQYQVFDKKSSTSIGFKRCLNLCVAQHELTESEAGVMRAVDALRDEAQHWFVVVEEELLYLHTRALITAFDAYLKRTLDDDLNAHIPGRVLPVSTLPVNDFDFLIDREYRLIGKLLKPGNRRRDEARGRIRALLSMEGLVKEGVSVTKRDVDRVEKAVREGKNIGVVFPRLATVQMNKSGEGPTVKVRFMKKEGAPVRIAAGDDPSEAGAIREVDMLNRYPYTATQLARRVRLTPNRSFAVRAHLALDADDDCSREFVLSDKQKPRRFSDKAVRRVREAIDGGLDLDAVWAAYVAKMPKRGSRRRAA